MSGVGAEGVAAEPAGGAGSALPTRLATFLGRDRELAEIRQRLTSVRLLTLTGPGGVGKTQLALRAADEASEMFADGVCFVPLAAVDDVSLVVEEIVHRLGVAGTGEGTAFDRLRAYVAERELLLVLDNFEHLLEAAVALPDILAAGLRVKLLVTSRAALRLSFEHVFPVAPLPVREPAADGGSPPGPARGPAVELFARRAQAVDPAFELTAEIAPVVADICEHLDGLPLAIELAATRVRLLPPAAMRSRLDQRLGFLTGGPRDLPTRQRTLRDAIRWSYELLDPAEQRLFRLLSVFSGGFGLEPAASVLEQTGATEVELLDSCAALIDHSMLVSLERPEAEPRFGMLETISEYARDQLDRSGEAEPTRQAHAEYFLAFCTRAEGPLHGPEQQGWLDRLERELPNVRVALRWLLQAGRSDDALACACALKRFWTARAHLAEGVRWLEEGVAQARGPSPLLSLGLSTAGWLSYHMGELGRAESVTVRGLDVARELGYERGRAYALVTLAMLTRWRGRNAEARAMYDEAAALFRTLGDRRGLADALSRAAGAAYYDGDHRAARPLSEEALALCRELGDADNMAYALSALAFCLQAEGDLESAARVADEALISTKAIGDRYLTARALYVLALIAFRSGDLAGARSQLEETGAIVLEQGGRPRVAAAGLPVLARVHLADGRAELAVRLLGCAEAERELTGVALAAHAAGESGDVVRALRRELGAERFAAAWAEGRRMTLEQALAQSREASDSTVAADARSIAPGDLTTREAEVLRLLARGMSDAEIAEDLVVSRRTVHAHLRAIYRKLDVGSRSAATRWALGHGLG